ncbi:aminoglycoside phosphotransferase family protein [Rhizobium sp.]
MMSKSIVEVDGRQYVLHRFRRHATFDRFLKLMQRISDSGASIQRIAAAAVTEDLQRRHGYCVALVFVPGTPFDRKSTAAGLASFAQNLARLHSVEGPENQPLFAAARPTLPYRDYLKSNPDLTSNERKWILGSHARMRSITANNLTHGDLYAANIIAGTDGRVSLIDYELMAFERAGIELSVALLRSFCRHAQDRRLLLSTYLEHCSPTLAQAWQTHFTDFLFAAAARLASQRRRRFERLTFYNRVLRLRAAILRSADPDIQRRIDKNERLRLTAERQAKHYARVARDLLHYSRNTRGLDPFEVFDAVALDRRSETPKVSKALQ